MTHSLKFGFDYTEDPGKPGYIIIEAKWLRENLSVIAPPWPLPLAWGGLAHTIKCHKKLAGPLLAVLNELEDAGREDRILDYGGCWNPRHVGANPKSGLSYHAAGLAVDFNVKNNPWGATPKQSQFLVATFKKHGWIWGGDFSKPDGMHFQLSDNLFVA